MILGWQIIAKSQSADSSVVKQDTVKSITNADQTDSLLKGIITKDTLLKDTVLTVLKDTIAIDTSMKETDQFATLYVYRPKNFTGSAISYDLHIETIDMCRVKNNSKFELKIRKEGKVFVWSKTESKSACLLDVKFGETYYIKCTVGMGLLVGHPELNIVDPIIGAMEYSQVKGR